jgi:maltose O-acetyltransferase
MSEREKMLAGQWYRSSDAELQAAMRNAQIRLRLLNALPNEDLSARLSALRELLGGVGEGTQLRSPFACDYGVHIVIGRTGFINFDCVFLDCNRITIGDDAQIGPGVHIYTAFHPVDPQLRRSGVEAAREVHIGNNVWLGGGCILCPGIKIGDGSVIGAGSVVTREIPPGVVAAGNPCRVLRKSGAE